MKRLVLIGVMTLVTGNSWAGCRVLEYAEMKDMTASELEAEVKYNYDEAMRMVAAGTKAMEQGQRHLGPAAIRAAEICANEAPRLQRVLEKKVVELKQLLSPRKGALPLTPPPGSPRGADDSIL